MSKTPTSTKALIGALLVGMLGLIVFFFVHLSGDGKKVSVGTRTAAAECTANDKCLPDVKFIDTVGRVYSRADLVNKVVVLNFWATWCKPCQREIPAFSRVYEKYKERGVVFLGILTGDNADEDTLLNFQSDNEMSYPVVRESSDIRASFIDDMESLPTTLIYGKGGKQVLRRIGALDDQKLAEMIEPLAAQKI